MARNIVLSTITAVFDIVVLTIGGSLLPSHEKTISFHHPHMLHQLVHYLPLPISLHLLDQTALCTRQEVHRTH
jgi:hypothetical protein